MADITRSRAFAPAPPWRLLAIGPRRPRARRRGPPAYVGSAAARPASVRAGQERADPVRRRTATSTSATRSTGQSRARGRRAGERLRPRATRPTGRGSASSATSSATATVDIYVVRPDGSDLRRITSSPISSQTLGPIGRPTAGTSPSIHPADECASESCVVSQLDLIDVNDGSVRTIATADGIDYVQFRPPDGRELLFRARVDGTLGPVRDGRRWHQRPPGRPGRQCRRTWT